MPFPSIPLPSAHKFSNSQLRRPVTLGIVFLLAAAAACPRARAQATTPPVTYTITDLGVLPGGDQHNSKLLYGGSNGYAINASGDVAGYSYTRSGDVHAVIFRAGQVIDLGVIPGANSSVAYGINGYDQATGYAVFPASGNPSGSLYHAFLYSAGKMKDIGTLPGDDISLGDAINDSGQITGISTTPSTGPTSFPNTHGFLYSAGMMTNLAGSSGDSVQTSGGGINASGQVAGWVGPINTSLQYAAQFSNGSITTLPEFPNEYTSAANAITDSGQATGYWTTLSGCCYQQSAFSYSNGMVIALGALPGDDVSVGNGINVAGEVVGDSDNAIPVPAVLHGFLYIPGQGMINVNSLAPKDSGWNLTDATAINDKGQITGEGFTPQGHLHAYLLSPVFTQFSTLNAVVDLIGKPASTFAAGGRFALGATSHGIDPLTETTVLQLGGYHISIPPGYFVKQANGVYYYHGKIGNVSTYAVIRPVAANVFLFGVVGEGAAGLPPSYPLNLVLTIGTDTGTESVPTNYNSGLTVAEACQVFGLTCN